VLLGATDEPVLEAPCKAAPVPPEMVNLPE